MIKIVLFALLFLGLNTEADQILGQYWTDTKEGKIEIYSCGDQYCGKIIWRKDARKDSKNPDASLKERSVIGIEFMEGFTYNPNKKVWDSGTVYSIDNGGTYSGKLWLEQGGKVLKMRGYLGISILGRTATLTRVD